MGSNVDTVPDPVHLSENTEDTISKDNNVLTGKFSTMETTYSRAFLVGDGVRIVIQESETDS